jgi:hypothetical protein
VLPGKHPFEEKPSSNAVKGGLSISFADTEGTTDQNSNIVEIPEIVTKESIFLFIDCIMEYLQVKLKLD